MNLTRFSRLVSFIFVLVFATLALGQFSVLFRFGQGSVYLFDPLIILFNVVGTILLFKSHKDLRVPLPAIFLLIFSALGFISLAFSPLNLEASGFITAASYPVRFVVYLTLGIITWNLVRDQLMSKETVLKTIIYSGLFLFLAGIAQLILLPDLETLDRSLGWDPHKNRMASTFYDPNFLGIYFLICLAVAFASKRHLIVPVLLMIGIFLTFSRSAWLATAVFVFISGLRHRTLLVASVLIILLAVFAIPRVQTRISGLTDPQDSAGFRIISWQNTWQIIRDHWVFGTGYNAFRYAQQEYGFLDDSNVLSRSGAGSDSSLMLVWATSGILGLFAFAGYYFVYLVSFIKKKNLIMGGLLVALLIDSAFINSLFYPQVLITYLLAFLLIH